MNINDVSILENHGYYTLNISKCHILYLIFHHNVKTLTTWRYKSGTTKWVSAPIGRYTVTCLSLGGLEPDSGWWSHISSRSMALEEMKVMNATVLKGVGVYEGVQCNFLPAFCISWSTFQNDHLWKVPGLRTCHVAQGPPKARRKHEKTLKS